jgi:hypothetical protein
LLFLKEILSGEKKREKCEKADFGRGTHTQKEKMKNNNNKNKIK